MIEDACTKPPLFTNFSFPRKINLFLGLVPVFDGDDAALEAIRKKSR